MNSYYSLSGERQDKIKSAVITGIIWSCILLFVFLYTVKEYVPKEKEVMTTMLINFGDGRNGQGAEEPASQEGSLAARMSEEENTNSLATTKAETVELAAKKESNNAEKTLTGRNDKISVPQGKETTKNTTSTRNAATSSGTKSSAANANSSTGSGDGRGTSAVGNLISGRGNKTGGQGTGSGVGNDGDPLGGSGYGNSRIGVDRQLISFIPGTMGRGGSQPSHKCTASGTINLSYTVDPAGNVTSVSRSSGASDPCIVSTSSQWVKTYVKAQRAGFSSTGVYKITF